MPETPEPPADQSPLQFDKAELAGGGGAACTSCRAPITGTYFEANGNVVCARCRAQLQWEESHGSGIGRFVKAGFFGTLAAALGSAIYYGVAALTNMEFGLIAILVGVMVGAAVKHGSRGRGGWLYQGLAIFLTYTSIVSTYIPPILKAVKEQSEKPHVAASPAPQTAPSPAPGPTAQPIAATQPAAAASPEPKLPGGPLVGLLLGLAFLFAIAFAAPFLGGLENIMGIIIIFIGLYEAWKINRRVPLVVNGPYRVGAKSEPTA
jgi:hypothetical protein